MNNFENVPHNIVRHDGDMMLLGNVMQLELAGLLHQDMMVFIENNAERFRGVVTSDPSLFGQYQEDREGTLKVILERMRVH